MCNKTPILSFGDEQSWITQMKSSYHPTLHSFSEVLLEKNDGKNGGKHHERGFIYFGDVVGV